MLLAFMASASAGRIVVNHDEWTISDSGRGIAGAASFDAFVGNLASYMNIDGGACSYLVYSSSFGLTGSSFASAMSGAGCSLTTYTGPFNTGLGLLSNYDGVFLAFNPSTSVPATLASYVDAGGSVYIAAGTGIGGPITEAAFWNAFLNDYGLNLLGTSYNGCCGVDAVSGTHPLLDGVSQLYYDNGNTVSLSGGNPNASIIEFSSAGLGLIGVFDDVSIEPPPPGVPSPGTLLCLAVGLFVMTVLRRAPLPR
jgi:hypothetical protein